MRAQSRELAGDVGKNLDRVVGLYVAVYLEIGMKVPFLGLDRRDPEDRLGRPALSLALGTESRLIALGQKNGKRDQDREYPDQG